MADGIHPSVQPMQPPLLEAVLDGTVSEPEPSELPARDHAVLAGRDVGDRRVDAARSTFPMTVNGNVEKPGHALILAGGS